jgi:endonuclease/exonuclease/phosphatase family metal-dependent hydrolase
MPAITDPQPADVEARVDSNTTSAATEQELSFRMSDHFPLWVEFEIRAVTPT